MDDSSKKSCVNFQINLKLLEKFITPQIVDILETTDLIFHKELKLIKIWLDGRTCSLRAETTEEGKKILENSKT